MVFNVSFCCKLLFSYMCVVLCLPREEVGVCLSVCKIAQKVFKLSGNVDKKAIKHYILLIFQIPIDFDL